MSNKQNYVRGCTRHQIKTFLEFLFGENIIISKEVSRNYIYVFPKNFFIDEKKRIFKTGIEAHFNNQISLQELSD